MKTTASFRLSAQTKRFMATILDPHKRGAYKRAMIDAELSGAQGARREKGRRDDSKSD
jgi:hypothetical protein